MSLKRPSTAQDALDQPESYCSQRIEDRGSSFMALFASVASIQHARTLQQSDELSGAMHRILAWRIPGRQMALESQSHEPRSDSPSRSGRHPRRLLETGFDEDGEKAAGKRVLAILENSNLQGALVVGRWWGGVMLGPARFRWIEDVARGAITAFLDTRDRPEKRTRLGVGQEVLSEKARSDLVAVLKERDESIRVLRGLLQSKKDGTSDKQEEQIQPAMNYDHVKTEVLQRLEAARDRTIAFLLAEIDKAEKQSPSKPEKPASSATNCDAEHTSVAVLEGDET